MFDTFSTIAYAIATGSIGFALAMALTHSGQRSDRVLFFCMLLTALLAHVLGQLLIVSGLYRLAPHLVGADLAQRHFLDGARRRFDDAGTDVIGGSLSASDAASAH